MKNVDLTNRTQEFIDFYKSMSPDETASAKVPILEHGEPGSEDYVKLIESNIILEYIEDVWGDKGPRLRPTNPMDAAGVRMFNESFGKMSPFGLIMGDSLEALQKKLQEMAKGMQIVDRCLQQYKKRNASGDFVMGLEFSQAECMAAPILVRAVDWLKGIRGVDMVQLAEDLALPYLVAWMRAVLSRPSVKETTPDVDLSENIKKVHPDWIKCEDKLTYKVVDGTLVF